ncbi:hypothetical protein ACJENL_27345, partial [Escherichia coli]
MGGEPFVVGRGRPADASADDGQGGLGGSGFDELGERVTRRIRSDGEDGEVGAGSDAERSGVGIHPERVRAAEG